MNKKLLVTKNGNCQLPNGYTLYWDANQVGGRTYWSDEIPAGVFVWDTVLVSEDTLLAAIVQEHKLLTQEKHGPFPIIGTNQDGHDI